MIDLRSDTLTQPTDGMRQAMAAAPVGDDVFGEDPTVNLLQERVAKLLGKEAALFVPTGTMGNQIGVRLHCGPGDEFLGEAQCHIYHYEQAAYAQLFGVAMQPVTSDRGLLAPDDLQDRIRGDDVHHPRTRLLCLENTHNRHGGVVLPQEGVAAVCQWARRHGLACHLDGARLWNAAIASGQTPAELAAPFDTVNVCFSKGLGAPAGSAIVGSAEKINQARRHRKAMGGGMRQSGILAAAALHAMEHHFDRLREDHQNAQILADACRRAPHLELAGDRCETNLVLFHVDPAAGPADAYCQRLREQGIAMLPVGKQKVRAVTHLSVSQGDVEQAATVIATGPS
ncbi:MAG: GntG family PLP-dependent aldolase [Planctomycetota bacterium]